MLRRFVRLRRLVIGVLEIMRYEFGELLQIHYREGRI